MSSRAQTLALSIALALSTFLAYSPIIKNNFILYDDEEYLTANPHIHQGLTTDGIRWAFTTGYAANWHPVTWLSHMLDIDLFGMNPTGHHLVNLALHIANTLLLFLLLRSLTGAILRSAMVAALFALHPLHVESVAWAAERKDLLSAFFAFVAITAFARFAMLLEAKSVRRTGFYTASLLAFALSLMSKPMMVTLPFLLLLIDVWPLRRLSLNESVSKGRQLKGVAALVFEKAPFFFLALLSCLVTIEVQRGATEHFRSLPFSDRLGNALVSYARYLGKAVWPHPLAAPYPHPSSWPPALVAGAAVLLVAITIVALLNIRKRVFIPFGWFWFLGTLIPVIGIIQVGVAAMADRYTYIPLIGVFISAVWWIASAVSSQRRQLVLGFGGASLCFVLGAMTFSQVTVWRDTPTFFTHAISVTQSNWVAHSNLAVFALRNYTSEVQQAGGVSQPASTNLAAVVLHGSRVLEYQPDFAAGRFSLAKALTEQGHYKEAVAQLQAGLHPASTNAEAWQLLAENYLRMGSIPEAVEHYRYVLRLRPDWDAVMNNLAWVLATSPDPNTRRPKEAIALAERACARTGETNVSYLHTLGAAYASDGRFTNAVAVTEQALTLSQKSRRKDLETKSLERLNLYKSARVVPNISG